MTDLKQKLENWKPVVGHEGRYEISNMGRVRSLIYSHGLREKPRVLKLRANNDGYYRFQITVELPSQRLMTKALSVSVEVLKAFVGPRPSEKHEAAHLNSVRTDNRLENLAWVTKEANMSHKRLVGTHNEGFKNPCVLLTKEQADHIVYLRDTTFMTLSEIAKETKIKRGIVARLLSRQAFRDYWAAREGRSVEYVYDDKSKFAIPARTCIATVTERMR